MHIWQLEQALATAFPQLLERLQQGDREQTCEGAIVRMVVTPERRVAVDMKLITAVVTDVETSDDDSAVPKSIT